MEQSRTDLINAGWERGVFVCLSQNEGLLEYIPSELKDLLVSIEDANNIYFVPVLYDCALISDDFIQEPWVNLIVCWKCGKSGGDGNFKYCKNPRKYHFPLEVNGQSIFFETNALSIVQMRRDIFLQSSINLDVKWPVFGLETMLNWLTERLRQPVFPDEWNERLKSKKKLLERFYSDQTLVEKCAGVFFRITPFSQIDKTERYSVSALIVTPAIENGAEHKKFNREIKPKLDELKEELRQILQSMENVDVETVSDLQEDQFTRKEERLYKRYQLEFMTYKSGEVDSVTLPADLQFPFVQYK
ncbi:TPA: hypothetical protein ACYU6U_002835 [Klebsiella pneumoniae]